MTIGMVSFRNTASNWQTMVSRPQSYLAPNQSPSASSNISGEGNAKKSKGLFGKVLLGAAVIAGGLFAGNKTGFFNKFIKDGGKLNNVLKYADNAGAAIAKLPTKATELWNKVVSKKVVQEGVQKAGETGQKLIEAGLT